MGDPTIQSRVTHYPNPLTPLPKEMEDELLDEGRHFVVHAGVHHLAEKGLEFVARAGAGYASKYAAGTTLAQVTGAAPVAIGIAGSFYLGWEIGSALRTLPDTLFVAPHNREVALDLLEKASRPTPAGETVRALLRGGSDNDLAALRTKYAGDKTAVAQINDAARWVRHLRLTETTGYITARDHVVSARNNINAGFIQGMLGELPPGSPNYAFSAGYEYAEKMLRESPDEARIVKAQVLSGRNTGFEEARKGIIDHDRAAKDPGYAFGVQYYEEGAAEGPGELSRRVRVVDSSSLPLPMCSPIAS